MSDIKSTLKDFICENFKIPYKIDFSTNLLENRIVDSIGIIELVHFIEGEFKISLPFETLSYEEFKTIDSIELLINDKKNKNKF
jgi:acyl carrier protein